jgi:hypothetical protein
MAAVWLYTSGEITSDGSSKDVEWDDNTRRAWYFHFFGLFWINAMFFACVQFVLIVGVAQWYFNHGTDASGTTQLSKGCCWTFRYHCGSLAFGSLILA